ncbi:MAG: efflux RND transporter periplasmic adaptor subunit [Planctomycetales bacterium]|jgi:HlyD family secretion protein
MKSRFDRATPAIAPAPQSASARSTISRRGASVWAVVLTLALLSVPAAFTVPAAIWSSVTDWFGSEPAPDYLTAEVAVGPFVHDVIEHGEIESSSNVEVRCGVRARSSSGINILEIIPEGSRVQAGDFLVRLDDAALQTELIQQQIIVTNSQAQVIESQATFDSAGLALEEYESGTFLEQEEQFESALFVAQENVRRAEEYLQYSQRLAERGYIPEVQLEADRFAVEKARKEKDVADTKLNVLRKFTRAKVLTGLKADVGTARARLNSRTKTLQLDEVRLKEIEGQIKKCVMTAPVAGQVVHANDRDRRGSSGDLLIEEGRPVRERQVIIRLPDPTKMRVIAKVHESRISHVALETQAKIVLDALPELDLTGKVSAVSEYPLPSVSVYTAHIKEYAVEVDIIDPPEGLRPGMSAQVAIMIAREAEAMTIPIQAVVDRAGRQFAAVIKSDGTTETRELKIGHINEEAVVILDGLSVGENVILTPAYHEDLLDLPGEESVVLVEADELADLEPLPVEKPNGAKVRTKAGAKSSETPKPGKTKPGKRS